MDATTLTAPERSDLRRLEKVIEAGVLTFVSVGEALKQIRDEKLYREKWKTFESYCEDRFNLSRPRAYQLIDAAKTVKSVKNLSTIVDKKSSIKPEKLVPNEFAARAIADVPEEELQEVIDEVVEQHQETGEPVSAKTIKQAAKKVADSKQSTLIEAAKAKKEPAWVANRDRADSFRVRINELIRDLKDLPNEPGLERMHSYRAHIVRDLEAAKLNLRGCTPEHICPYCHGRDSECNACKGHGWVTKSEFTQAPKEMRDEVERISNGGNR